MWRVYICVEMLERREEERKTTVYTTVCFSEFYLLREAVIVGAIMLHLLNHQTKSEIHLG